MVRAFDFDGQAYRKASAHQQDWGQKLIEELPLRGQERVLDLGCGDGRLTARLADRVPSGSVLGIDASPGMLATASALERPNLHFVLMDIGHMEFAGEFDVVFSNATLHWIKDHARLLAAVHKALAPGGVARFSFAGQGNCMNFHGVARRVMAEPEYAGLFRTFDWPWFMPSAEEYLALARESPFRDANVRLENADRVFADQRALVGWIDQPSLVPFLQHLPEHARAGFRDAVVQAMLAQTRQESGGFLETFRRLNFSAAKP